jgi:hypothetical protein
MKWVSRLQILKLLIDDRQGYKIGYLLIIKHIYVMVF